MPISAGMIAHLEQSPKTLCTLWRVEERRREVLVNWSLSSRANVQTRGGYLFKEAGTDGTDDAGAFSSNRLNGDGYLRFATKNNGTIHCGLSESNSGADADGIKWCIRVDADGTIKVYELGTLKATHTATARRLDWLKIRRIGATLTYWHNRSLIYTSTVASSATLHADASIATKYATIEQASFGHDPAIITVSNHTRRLTYNGELYTPGPLTPSQLEKNAGLETDNAEITWVLSSEGFNRNDLRGGRWNHARVEIITVNYEDLTLGPARRSVGYIGEIKFKANQFTAEFRGLSQLLSQETNEKTSALCRVKRFGDQRCGVNLTNYSHDATISMVSDALRFTVDLSPAKADNYFRNGTVYWRTGNNKLYEREIKGNVGNAIELAEPMPLEVEAGDTITLIAGCDRSRAACKSFANDENPSGTNIENFQGEPDIPGLSKVFQFPE